MEKASSAQRLLYVGLTQFILVSWLAASGLCCLEDVHPGNCSCTPFGHRMIVTCKGIKQVPRDLPSNTATINLSGNNLSSIQEDTFRNLTLLSLIDLSGNSLQSIPYGTFRNLTKLTYMQVELSVFI
ncbi:leucine-rich repeat-containing protein 4-like [Oculina patagonica]